MPTWAIILDGFLIAGCLWVAIGSLASFRRQRRYTAGEIARIERDARSRL